VHVRPVVTMLTMGWRVVADFFYSLYLKIILLGVSSTTNASIFNEYSTLHEFSIVNPQMSLLAKLFSLAVHI